MRNLLNKNFKKVLILVTVILVFAVFSIFATDAFYIDGDGDLDIYGGLTVGNTTSPTAGTIRWSGTDFEGYDGSSWESLTSGSGDKIEEGDSEVEVIDTGDGYVEFVEDGSEVMRITGGNVGIGTTSTYGYKLFIYGTTGFEGNTTVTAGTFRVDDNVHLALSGSTKVGIGTTTPTVKLHVQGDTTINGMLRAPEGFLTNIIWALDSGGVEIWDKDEKTGLKIKDGGDTYIGYNIGIGDYTMDAHLEVSANGTTGGSIFMLSSNDNNDGDLMIVKENGGVGIGTTSPNYKLEVSGPVMLEDASTPGYASGHSGIYSSSGELYAIDQSGNTTQLSPHDAETGEWVFYSKNVKTGRVLRIDMEKLMILLAEEMSEKTGETFIQEYYEK